MFKYLTNLISLNSRGDYMKYPSRNRKVVHEDIVICPYCRCKYKDEEDKDFYMCENTKINICRECFEEFINGCTRDVLYKYS